MSNKNPLVFLDVSIDGGPAERMLFELFSNVVPMTAENFRALCTGEKGISPKCGKPLHYKGSLFHHTRKGSMAEGGDFLNCDGTYGESIYQGKFPDESPKLEHDRPGLLSMAIADRDSWGSLFTITFNPKPDLDRKSVVFGKLVQGFEVLKKIENAGDEEGIPSLMIKIVDSGELHETDNQNFVERKEPTESDMKTGSSDNDSNTSISSSASIVPGYSNPLNLDDQESSGIDISSTPITMQKTNTTPMPFGLDSNNIGSCIASVISPQEGYLRTCEKLQSINTTNIPSFLIESEKRLLLENPDYSRKLNLEGSGRRKTLGISDEDILNIRCKCSKSKCLKRYCECFAAGLYCEKSCTCVDCYNLLEYEDTVEVAKEQVQARDPHAFGPKIDSKSCLAAASSARDRQPCNCKKSLCSKKYCDCYKIGVGCTDGCHCEGCRNIYGTKEEYLARKPEGEKLEAARKEKFEKALTGVDFPQTNLLNHKNFSLASPFQYLNHGQEDASKAPFPHRGFVTQDYSDLRYMNPHLLPSCNSNYPVDLDNIRKVQDTTPLQIGPTTYNTTSCQLHGFSQRIMPNDSGSEQYNLSSPLLRPNPYNLINRTSLPQTNMLNETEQNERVEDEMPKILQEESTSQNSVKVSSPNQKRVSPPSTEPGGSSADGGLSSCHIVWQSLPPAPL